MVQKTAEVGALRRSRNATRALGLRAMAMGGGLLGLWVPLPARGEVVFRGRDVLAAIRSSVDVVDAHLNFLQLQSAYDRTLGYMTLTTRWAPGRAKLADGQSTPTNLSRTQFNLGSGFGAPSKWAIFGGANIDLTGLTPSEGLANGLAGQSLLFAGVAFSKVQLTVASKQSFTDANAIGLDPWGNFQTAESDPNFESALRPGTPSAIANPTSNEVWLTNVLTAYEGRSGAFVSVTWADVPTSEVVTDPSGRRRIQYGPAETRITDLRLNLQPLHDLFGETVRNTLGLPTVGLRRLDATVAALLDGDLPEDEDDEEEAETSDDVYELDFGTDDMLAGGFRWRVIQRVRPEVFLRRAEFGYVQILPLAEQALRVGARALYHRADDGSHLSGEGFVAWSLSGGTDLERFGASLSYSYNSPDTATFLPITHAHVIGIQAIWGSIDGARPIVPLVREVESRHGRSQ